MQCYCKSDEKLPTVNSNQQCKCFYYNNYHSHPTECSSLQIQV